MSPFLFALCIEYLSRCLSSLSSSNKFTFHPKCDSHKLSHLLFADDLLLFSHGDLRSIKEIFGQFSIFSASSGLQANLDKCAVFLSGVDGPSSVAILEFLGMNQGSLPVRYLGVPLASRKPSKLQCNQLVSKICECFHHWSTKHLTYAGRLQLISSVCSGIKNFWAQIFILPSLVINEVNSHCRSFLWSGSENVTRKSPVAWEQVCLPRIYGGLNIQNFAKWNKAAILKLLWAVAKKEDKLWVKWVHGRYIKNRNLFSMGSPANAAWIIRKIFHQRDFVSSRTKWDAFVASPTYSIKVMYRDLVGVQFKPPWRFMFINNKCSPRAKFIVWLFCQQRLPTQERLSRFGIDGERSCPLCNSGDDSLSHIFLFCQVTSSIKRTLLDRFECHSTATSVDEEITRLGRLARKKSKFIRLYIVLWSEWCYHIWLHRCRAKY